MGLQHNSISMGAISVVWSARLVLVVGLHDSSLVGIVEVVRTAGLQERFLLVELVRGFEAGRGRLGGDGQVLLVLLKMRMFGIRYSSEKVKDLNSLNT